jgi:hypothetical protein
MCSNEPDVNQPIFVNYHNYQPVMVTFDIEDDPVIYYKTGVAINSFDISRAFPDSTLNIVKPGLQGNSSIGMFFPEITQNSAADDPHG